MGRVVVVMGVEPEWWLGGLVGDRLRVVVIWVWGLEWRWVLMEVK